MIAFTDIVGAIVLVLWALILGPLGFLRGTLSLSNVFWYMTQTSCHPRERQMFAVVLPLPSKGGCADGSTSGWTSFVPNCARWGRYTPAGADQLVGSHFKYYSGIFVVLSSYYFPASM